MRGVVRLDSMADDALVAWIKCPTFDEVLSIPLFAERIPQYGHSNWAFFSRHVANLEQLFPKSLLIFGEVIIDIIGPSLMSSYSSRASLQPTEELENLMSESSWPQ